ncbi:AT-rich interactive domain-containing protein 2-like [Actinia tenebrosa]|uniref:AT-rich interactive domain-containing protein 2-like n=1 Tax=Actinia tenebrosa TaxID=6105 RepID=A0A6P8IBT2_ACTTE|nr:AT-rich interactive domain-containing protein 2-like [Actinia tenebrosa]
MFQPMHFRKTAKELGMDPATYEKEYNYFLAKLKKFHESKGSPFRRLPWLGGQFLDLYLLYKKVTSYGGWIKVTEDKKWRDIAEVFNLPSTCTNAAFALRQHYSRYLETYERINFFGEDVEDVMSSGRPHTPVSVLPGIGPSEYTSPGTTVDITRNFEKLVLSLECGLPNEVDFAINICMLLSNVNNSVFNLTKAPAIMDMLLGHVGVFIEDSHGLKDVYNEWYQKTERDFVKFWRETLEVEEFRDILCGGQEKTEDSEEQLFNPGKTYGVNSVEAQRVAQVCMILYNFSFDETNAEILASHSSCLRLLMLCICNQMGYLQSLAWNTLCNLAEKMKLEPVVSKNTQILFRILHYFLEDKDRFKVIKAMDVLGKLCIREDNDEVIESALEIQGYESLLKILIIPDVQLVVGSLEALYNISGVGQETSYQIASVDHGVDILVCMATLDVEFLGPQALSEVIVIENRLPMTRPRPIHSPPAVGGPPSPSPASPQTPSVSTRNEVDAEGFTVKWLQATYEALPSGTVSRIDLYADYLSSCSRLARIGILNASAFNRIVKFVFPDAQLRRFPAGNQLQYALFGIRRRANPLPVHSSVDQQVAPTPPPQVMASQASGTPSRVMGTPSGAFHQDISRAPTPPTPGCNSPNWNQGVPQRPVPQGVNVARQTPPSPSGPFPGNLQNGGFNQGTPIQKVQRRPNLPGQQVIGQETGLSNVQQQNVGQQTQVTAGQMMRPQGPFPNQQQQAVTQRPMFNAQNQVPVQQPNLQKTIPSNAVCQQSGNMSQVGLPQIPTGQWQQNAVVSQGTTFQGTPIKAIQPNSMTVQQPVNSKPSAQVMQCQNMQGQAIQAQVTQVQAMQSHTMQSHTMQGQMLQGQAMHVQTMQGQAMQGQAQGFQRPMHSATSMPTPIQPRPPQMPAQAMTTQNSQLGLQAQQLVQQRQQVARMPSNQRPSLNNMMQRPGSPGMPPRIAPRGNMFSRHQQGLVPIRPAPPVSVQSPSPSSSQPGPGHNERSHNGPPPLGIQRPYQFRPQRPIQGQEVQRLPQGAQLQGFQQVQKAQDPRNSSQPFMGRPRAAQPQMGPNQGMGGFPVRNSGPIAIAPKPAVDQSVSAMPTTCDTQQRSSDGIVLIAREEKAEDILTSDILKNSEEQRIIVVENTNNIQKNKMNHQTASSIPNLNNIPEHQGTTKRDFKSRQSNENLNSEGLVTPDQVDHNGHDSCLSDPKRIRLDGTNVTNNIEDSSSLDCTTDEPSGLVNGDVRNDSRNKLMDKLLGKDLHMPLNGVCDINSSDLDLMATEGERLSGSNSKASSPDIFDSENNSDFGKYLEESDTDTGLFSDVILGDLRLDSVETDPKSKTNEQHKNIPSLPDLGYLAVAQELRNPSSLPSKLPSSIDVPVAFSKGAQNSLPEKVPITAVSAIRPQQQRAPGPNEIVLGRYGNQTDGFQGRPQLLNHDGRPSTSWNGPVRPQFPPSYQSSVQNNNTQAQNIRQTGHQQLNAILEHRTKALVTPRMPVTETQEIRQFAPQQQTPLSKPSETPTNGIPDTHPISGCPGLPVSTATSSTTPIDGGTQIPRTVIGSPPVETVKPFRCKWANCTSAFDSSKQLFNHVVSAHVPRDSLVLTCMWENCVPVRRSRSSLLFHLQQRHSGPTPVNAPPTPQPQATPTPTPTTQHNPSYFPAYRLLARMMGALQEEEESPLTKTIRLTSALVLRNIAQYSAVARSHLRRHERLLSEVAMSNSEAAHAVAACLSELSPHRKTTEDSNNTFIWAFDR